jgi:REP element-mobilizing transposase RayT
MNRDRSGLQCLNGLTQMDDSPDLPNLRSVRLRAFDYSQLGSYFITIQTHRSKHILGKIILGQMKLNRIGQAISECWMGIPNHFPGIELEEYVVMPNHLHGIVMIRARARHAVPLQTRTEHAEAFSQPRPASIPTMVRSFKSAATQYVRKALGQPKMQIWQRNYFERIIRSPREFQKIRKYITLNPARWEFDRDGRDEPFVFDDYPETSPTFERR